MPSFIQENRPEKQEEILAMSGKKKFIEGKLYEWRADSYGFDGWHLIKPGHW